MFKKRIGITQKVYKHPVYNETMDCLDINWTKLLVSLNILPVPLPLTSSINARKIWNELGLDGLILTGGNTLHQENYKTDNSELVSKERDAFEKSLIEEAMEANIPILGVCRGLQLINVFFKGGLKKIENHVGLRHTLITEKSKNQYHLPFEVNSYHDFGIPRYFMGEGLISLAHDKDNNIEAMIHCKHKILGIMWHPERDFNQIDINSRLLKGFFNI